jgi:glycosyltransferase involved in cell wall biosynthesis
VIATGRGGSGEYLRHGDNCLIFDPDSGGPGLAAAIRELADRPTLREELRGGGLATASRFPEGAFNDAVLRHLPASREGR